MNQVISGKGLRLENITHRFGGMAALMNVSFSLNKGEVLGVIGPNGAGKTTLFDIITGFIRPTRGNIFYDNKEITGLKPHRIVDLGVARTFQIVRPFSGMTVYENILVAALSPRARRAQRSSHGDLDPESTVMESLERVMLLNRKDEGVKTLLQGDLKRLELARALATNPDVILLDEPFSGLSYREMENLAALILDLDSEGRSILIIEHKLKVLMALVQRILVLDFGNLIAEGSPEAVVKDETVIKAYLGRQRKDIVRTCN